MGLFSSKDTNQHQQELQTTLHSQILPKIHELEQLFKTKIDQFDHKIGQLQQSHSISQMHKSINNNRLDILIQSFDKNNQKLQDLQNNLQKNQKQKCKTTQNIQQIITNPFSTEQKIQLSKQAQTQEKLPKMLANIGIEDSLLVSQSCQGMAIGNAEVLRHMQQNNELFIQTIQVLQTNLDIKMDEQSQLIMDSYQQNLTHTSHILQLLQNICEDNKESEKENKKENGSGKNKRSEKKQIQLQDLIDNQQDIISKSSLHSVRKKINKKRA